MSARSAPKLQSKTRDVPRRMFPPPEKEEPQKEEDEAEMDIDPANMIEVALAKMGLNTTTKDINNISNGLTVLRSDLRTASRGAFTMARVTR